MEKHPTVLWAETKQHVFLTVDLQGITDWKTDLDEDQLSFSCKLKDDKYKFELTFPHPINKEESLYNIRRDVQFKLVKKEPQRWGVVDKSAGKKHWLKCDWNRWVDSDDDEANDNMGDFDMGSMNFGDGMGDIGGMGGMDDGIGDDIDSGSDDDGLSDLGMNPPSEHGCCGGSDKCEERCDHGKCKDENEKTDVLNGNLEGPNSIQNDISEAANKEVVAT